ncbi:MAG: class IV adenylate cyclase [Spirochaetales bacterium]|nr:class IV adenylate cyclase [Spirochaetales bacterium]
MFEIELKAWITAPESLKEQLIRIADFVKSFSKKDYYFLIPGKQDWFRLRIDGGKNIVTVKDKNLVDGVEINKEVEYCVDSQDSFIEFAQMIGSKLDIIKYKRGDLFVYNGYNIELCELVGLGWFVEIEKLTEDSSKIDQIKQELREILALLGVGESQIESRLYIDMLKEKNEDI